MNEASSSQITIPKLKLKTFLKRHRTKLG